MREHATAHGWRTHLVIPEAVPLDLPLAELGTRSIAFAIDFALQLGTIALLALLGAMAGVAGTGAAGAVPGWLATVTVLLLTFAVWWGYPIACETLLGGRTLGKALMGLRVVTVEGGPVRLRHAVLRAVLGLIDFGLLLGAGAVVSSLVTSRSQRLGDLAAGTVVVRERTAAAHAQAHHFTVPAGYEDYAATIDPTGLRPSDYQAVRQFLLRSPELDPPVLAEVAHRLAPPLERRTGHSRPPAISEEVFLRCLAVRHQEHHRPAAAEPGHQPSSGPAATADFERPR